MKHRYLLSLFACLLLTATGCSSSHRLVPSEYPDPLPSFYVPKRIRVALVLGSGGMRGMAHLGVLHELESAGIPIDLIVGCSAGSIVGALYADNPCADSICSAVSKVRSQSLLDFDFWNCRYGLCQMGSMRRVMSRFLGCETFDELQIPLVVVASDLHTGELVPIGGGSVVKAVQASCCIPFVFVPCEYMGRVLVDGGVINPVPVKVAYDLGAEIVIAVDLGELLPHTWPRNLFGVATRSAEIAYMWHNEACTHAADVIIRPRTCGVGSFNDDAKWMLYEAGQLAASEAIPDILELLEDLSCASVEDAGWRLVEPSCYTPDIYVDDDDDNSLD